MGGKYELKTIVATVFNIVRPDYDYSYSESPNNIITSDDITLKVNSEGYTVDIDYGLWYHRSGARQLVDVILETSEIIAPFNTVEYWTEVIYQFNAAYEKRFQVQEIFRKLINWNEAQDIIIKQLQTTNVVKSSVSTRLVTVEHDTVL